MQHQDINDYVKEKFIFVYDITITNKIRGWELFLLLF